MSGDIEVTSRFSRRTAVRGMSGAGLAGVAALGGRSAVAVQAMAQAEQIEPEAGTWGTWMLSSADQLRPDAPPDDAATEKEAAEVANAVEGADAETLDAISYWDAGSPGFRWNEIATTLTLAGGFGAGGSYRTMLGLNVAIDDATVAAWDAKYAFERPRPAVADPTFQSAIPTPASPSYPCEHAAAAGAASTVLAYLFPEAAEDLTAKAEAAAASRVAAGVAYPSDGEAGLALGRAVGELVVAELERDGSDAAFDPATMPTGPGIWDGDPTTLADPMMGTWRTWVLTDGKAMRPPEVSADTPEWEAEVEELKNYPRDANPFMELFFWPENPAGRPAPDTAPVSSNQIVFHYAPILHYLWGPELARKLFEYRWDANPPRAARAYALVSVACYDASVACWDAKFANWTARPTMIDPEVTTIVPTYPIPDYPSGHAAGLGGTSEVLAALFPRDAHLFQSRAAENAASRMWAGVHVRTACEVGLALGRQVGQAVAAHGGAMMRTDGGPLTRHRQPD